MDEPIDLAVAELLASRLCHDLVGPVGAVNNGMELLAEEADPAAAGEAVRLAADSAGQAAAVLQFYRMAFGTAALREPPAPDELRRLAEGWLARSKARLDWPEAPWPAGAPAGLGKLVLNMLALAAEALPRGGTLEVAVEAGPAVRVTAAGEGAALREESRAALTAEADPAGLTPRTVQAHFTALLARRLGARLTLEAPAADTVVLAANLGG